MKLYVPGVVGVPLMTPVVYSRLSPSGNDGVGSCQGNSSYHSKGSAPFMAEKFRLKELPTVADGRGD